MKLFITGAVLLVVNFYVIYSQIVVIENQWQKSGRKARNQSSSNHFGAKELKAIHAKAKSISHSKGPIVNVDGKNPEYRRSIIRKLILKTNSLALRKVLNILQNCTDEDMVPTLEALNLLVHEFDTAIDFMNFGGMELIISLVQTKDDKIASAALSVLSAAMQGNPFVQRIAAESHILDVLLANLTGKTGNYLSSLLFTISSYLRNMPESQMRFFQKDGIFFLADIIESNNSLKLRLHSIVILADLATEILQESKMDYQKMKLAKSLVDGVQATDVCEEIANLLYGGKSNFNPENAHSEYLFHEKIVHAMSALHAVCVVEFRKSPVQRAIEKLILKYDPFIKVSWFSTIDKELKMSIHIDLKKLYEQMHKNKNLRKYEL